VGERMHPNSCKGIGKLLDIVFWVIGDMEEKEVFEQERWYYTLRETKWSVGEDCKVLRV